LPTPCQARVSLASELRTNPMKIELPRVPVRVPGFQFGSAACGIKESGNQDVSIVFAERGATAAAAFTTNRVCAAPVQIARAHVQNGRIRAIVTNSGNANAFTGETGLRDARRMCEVAARELGVPVRQVLPCSTGRIGVPLPMDRLEHGIREACRTLSADRFYDALAGIMTTDAFPKFAVRTIELAGTPVTLAGMAKGAGMIAPRMRVLVPHATLLSFILTDAHLSPMALRRVLQRALPETFNAIVVDGDTSTNDTVVLLASGQAETAPISERSVPFSDFARACTEIMGELARMVVRDGEGATRVVTVHVRGARTKRDAETAADAVARSPLCKAAFHGGDPYMGRVVCALGYSGAEFDPDRLRIYLNDLLVVEKGTERVRECESEASTIVSQPEFTLSIDLGAGAAQATRICSDLTEDYVRFNSAYRT